MGKDDAHARTCLSVFFACVLVKDLEKPSAEVWLVILQRQLAEVRFEILLPQSTQFDTAASRYSS